MTCFPDYAFYTVTNIDRIDQTLHVKKFRSQFKKEYNK